MGRENIRKATSNNVSYLDLNKSFTRSISILINATICGSTTITQKKL